MWRILRHELQLKKNDFRSKTCLSPSNLKMNHKLSGPHPDVSEERYISVKTSVNCVNINCLGLRNSETLSHEFDDQFPREIMDSLDHVL